MKPLVGGNLSKHPKAPQLGVQIAEHAIRQGNIDPGPLIEGLTNDQVLARLHVLAKCRIGAADLTDTLIRLVAEINLTIDRNVEAMGEQTELRWQLSEIEEIASQLHTYLVKDLSA